MLHKARFSSPLLHSSEIYQLGLIVFKGEIFAFMGRKQEKLSVV